MRKEMASTPYAGEPNNTSSQDTLSMVKELNASLAACETERSLEVLRQFARVCGGMPTVARLGGLHEKTLYKSLAPDGNPTLRTLLTLANVMNMRLAFLPKKK